MKDGRPPSSFHREPPSLSIDFGSNSRRTSTSSSGDSSASDENYHSPPLSALDSSAALILVHNDEDATSPIYGDEEERDYDEELVTPIFEVRKGAAFPPLPPSLVFLYLLAPYLRIGALNLPYTQLSLKYGLPVLLISALASIFARQLWYMLARYVKQANMTDILLDTFARGRGKERWRMIIRGVSRSLTVTVSILLSVVYLRYSMHTMSPLLANSEHSRISYTFSTMAVGVILGYFSYARSLNYRRVVYATWLSLVTYIAWLGCTIYAYSHGILEYRSSWLDPGTSVWPGLVTAAFAFCSSSTLPLYASLKSPSLASSGKEPRTRSFRLLSFSSVLVAILLLLPSTLFAAFPKDLATVSRPSHSFSVTELEELPPPTEPQAHIPVLSTIPGVSPDLTLPSVQLHTVIRILSASTLLLSIPSVLAAAPPLAVSFLRSVKFNVSRVVTIIVVIVASIIPPQSFPSGTHGEDSSFIGSSIVTTVATISLLFMGLAGTYFVPALVHISQHFFKRPLSIVIPPRTHLAHTPPTPMEHSETWTGFRTSSPRAVHDELLMKKERALQRKQSRKRIVWDIGVWLLLFASVACVTGFGGYLIGLW